MDNKIVHARRVDFIDGHHYASSHGGSFVVQQGGTYEVTTLDAKGNTTKETITVNAGEILTDGKKVTLPNNVAVQSNFVSHRVYALSQDKTHYSSSESVDSASTMLSNSHPNLENIARVVRKHFFAKLPIKIRDRVAVAGGYLRDGLLGSSAKDIDIYSDSPETEAALVAWMDSQKQTFKALEHTNDVWNYRIENYLEYNSLNVVNWQIIKNRHSDMKTDYLIRQFDFTMCGVMMTNENIFVLPTFFNDLYSKRLIVNKITSPDLTFTRTIKFIKDRKFTIDATNMKAVLDAIENKNLTEGEAAGYDSGRREDQKPYAMNALKRGLLSKLPPRELIEGIVTACNLDSSKASNRKAWSTYHNPMDYASYDSMILTLREFPNFTADTLLQMDEYNYRVFSVEQENVNRWMENTKAYKDYVALKTDKYLYKVKDEV